MALPPNGRDDALRLSPNHVVFFLSMSHHSKAVLKPPHSKRWCDGWASCATANRMECGAFTAAFGSVAIPWRFRGFKARNGVRRFVPTNRSAEHCSSSRPTIAARNNAPRSIPGFNTRTFRAILSPALSSTTWRRGSRTGRRTSVEPTSAAVSPSASSGRNQLSPYWQCYTLPPLELRCS